MSNHIYVARAGLSVHGALADFVEREVLPGTGIAADYLWAGIEAIFTAFADENRVLLAERDRLQQAIDEWHDGHPAAAGIDQKVYTDFLREIGYLADEPAPFTIDTGEVDPEIATIAGPQLVVPVLNARFLLNAANARWGSLYDALYGSDALAAVPSPDAPYDPARGAMVTAWAKAFLDRALPLAQGSWTSLDDASGGIALQDPTQYVGRSEKGRLFRNHGLHIEIVFDPDHEIGRADPSGIADVILESALSTIVDFEDSVAAVDAVDKVAAYRNWLGLMRGDLAASVEKTGRRFTRTLAEDRRYLAPDGTPLTLPGRALLLARTVGHLMTTSAVRLADGRDAPEGIIDGILCSLIAPHDRARTGDRNSRSGAIYLVKPKMHGPAEADFSNRLFDAIEDLLGLPRHSIKIGVMDEERRTSVNLAACIHTVRHRLFFINTGFLDRTGDELHTSMRAGAMIRKGAMKAAPWIEAYEDRNVQIGLACGLAGRAQIGKGMWAMPDRMADMLAQKSAHPVAGASTAWVPSPTAATLHALHYHDVDVAERQRARSLEAIAPLDALLTIPLAAGHNWSAEEIREELDNNVQGILGYVSRWIDQGIGCSKVPDINDIGLMEDRATLRISSQHLANWLMHGVCTRAEIDAAFARMAAKVDAQNAGDPAYRPLGSGSDSLALQAARALVYEGRDQPNGYTEPLLHAYRSRVKDRHQGIDRKEKMAQ